MWLVLVSKASSTTWITENYSNNVGCWAYRISNYLCVLSKMLKALIRRAGIPQRSVPQIGIFNPLLANVVLNKLDWWIASWWETFSIETKYRCEVSKYENLRLTSHMKENIRKAIASIGKGQRKQNRCISALIELHLTSENPFYTEQKAAAIKIAAEVRHF